MKDKQSFFEKLKGFKSKEIIIALILSAIVLLVFFGNFGQKSAKETNAEYNFSEYVNGLQNKIESVIKKIDGVGNAEIVITFSGGIEQEYAYSTEVVTQGSTVTEKHTLATVSGKPVLIREKMPQIQGVVIAADGAGQTAVRLEIIRAVQALLQVPNGKIEVFKRS